MRQDILHERGIDIARITYQGQITVKPMAVLGKLYPFVLTSLNESSILISAIRSKGYF